MKLVIKKLVLLALAYLILPQALAASFTATVSPTLINSSTPTQVQLNITNLDSANNITQVNLTLPPNFTYIVGTCTNCTGPIGSVIYWTEIIQPGSSSNFNFSITADVNGTRNFTVSTLDSANSTTQNYTNNFEVNDTTPPRWSNPVGPATSVYSPGAIYQFSITWTDNVGLSSVVFFWGGVPTTPNATGNTYTATLSDLKVGSYTYYWYANDTNKNSNQTSFFTFNVTKAPNPLNVYFNSTLNQNISMTVNTSLLLSLTGVGSLTLYQRGPEDKDYSDFPQTFTPTRLGKYNFTATATGNENYTTNYSTYFILVLPSYNIQTSIPATYSTASTFTITFSSQPELDTLLIEGSWLTGKQPVANSSLTQYSYSIVLPAGSFSWQLYANSSNDIFPLTGGSFMIAKAVPALFLTASPGWYVQRGTQTTVQCSSVVPVTLYRNGTQVSSPDVQTLPLGTYTYVCEGDETQNYTSTSESAILIVTREAFANFSFVQVPSLVLVEQNSSNTTLIAINNTGNVNQTITLTIEGIHPSLWTVNATNITLLPGATGTFSVNFSITNESAGDYQGIFKAYSQNKTITSNFTLRILLSESARASINKTLEGYKLLLLAIEVELNKTREAGFNVTTTEETLNTLKSMVAQAEDYIQKGDYTSAANILQSIDDLPEKVKNELERVKASGGSYTLYVVIGVAVGLAVLLAYLFWPTEVVSEAPTPFPPPKLKKSLIERLKEILTRKRKYKYKG